MRSEAPVLRESEGGTAKRMIVQGAGRHREFSWGWQSGSLTTTEQSKVSEGKACKGRLEAVALHPSECKCSVVWPLEWLCLCAPAERGCRASVLRPTLSPWLVGGERSGAQGSVLGVLPGGRGPLP